MFALTPGFFNASPEGCYAEFVAADADWVARVPDNLPLEQARKLHGLLRCRLMPCSWGSIVCITVCARQPGPGAGALRRAFGGSLVVEAGQPLAELLLGNFGELVTSAPSHLERNGWHASPSQTAGGGRAAGGADRLAGAAAGQASGGAAGADQRSLRRRWPRCGAGKLVHRRLLRF